MTTWQLLISGWHWHPSVLLGCAALLLGYLGALRFRPGKPALFFVAGVLVLLVALLSPIHPLGDHYLFSAHMLQHLLLTLIVPPLLLLGIPPQLARQSLNWSALRRTERVLSHPLVAGVIGNGAMWVWHVPALYNAALEHQVIHIVQHLSFLVTAMILWWPVVAPLEESRLAPPVALLYIFVAMVTSSVLGMILTFAPPGLYPTYLQPIDTLGILPLLRDGWGFSPEVDQQLGGLLMWVPGNLVYFCAFIGTLARWYRAPEEDLMSSSAQGVIHEPALSPQQRSESDVA